MSNYPTKAGTCKALIRNVWVTTVHETNTQGWC